MRHNVGRVGNSQPSAAQFQNLRYSAAKVLANGADRSSALAGIIVGLIARGERRVG
jgi:hypothetical protein